jgi:hypothetical protein
MLSLCPKMAGRAIWGKRFKRAAERVQREREKNLRRAEKAETHRLERKLAEEDASIDQLADQPDWIALWSLKGERPPPSSIVSRVDTVRFLLTLCCLIYLAHAAPKGRGLKTGQHV